MPEWPGAMRRRDRPSAPRLGYSARRSPHGCADRRRQRTGTGRYRVLDVGCGIKPYYPFFEPYVDDVRRRRHRGQPGCRPHGAVEALPVEDGASTSSSARRCSSTSTIRSRPSRAAPRRGAGRPRARVDARRAGLPPSAGRLLALDAHRPRAAVPRERELVSPSPCRPGAGRRPAVAMIVSTYIDLLFRRARARPPAVPPLVRRSTRRGRASTVAVRRAARSRARGSLYRELPRRGVRSKAMREGTRHRRRRLHRLEPRARAARARRRRARARQLLDRQPREPGGARRRDRRGRAAELRARAHGVRGVEVVFHLGALGSVPRSVQDPLTSSAVNVEGTLNVLLAARDEGVRRVVFSSSSSVYGDARRAAARARTAPPDPISPYGVAKLAAERYCVSFARVYDAFETVVLRYFNVFGPRQSPRSQYAAVVPLFITAIADGRAGHDLRRRRAVARLHVRRTTSSTRPSAPPDADGASGAHLQRRRRRACERERPRRHDRRHPRQPVEKAYTPTAAGRHPRLVGRLIEARATARLRAARRPRGRAAADGRMAAWLSRSGVLRVIARLNMGGPALHVAYLTAGLRRPRLRHDARRRHARARRGVDGVRRRGARRARRSRAPSSIARSRRCATRARSPARQLIRRERPHDPAHAHGEGRRGRTAGGAARRATRAPPIVVHTFHGHVLRGYFDPLRARGFRLARARARAADDDARRRQPARCATTSSRSASRPREKFAVVRLGIELDERVGADADGAGRDPAAARRRRRTAFVVGWIGRMTGVKRTGRRPARVPASCASAASTRPLHRRRRARPGRRSSGTRTSSASSADCLFLGYQERRRRAGTPRSTR